MGRLTCKISVMCVSIMTLVSYLGAVLIATGAKIPDLDGDGVPDPFDYCPQAAEDYLGDKKQDGCPQEPLKPKTVEIAGTIHFATGSASLLRRISRPALNQVVELLKNEPSLKKLEIQGHTDNQGRRRINKRLSKLRALAVKRYLIKSGIEPDRLEIAGLGGSQPVATNRTRQGRAQNRRVEFHIKESAGE